MICLSYVIGSQNERWGNALNNLPLLFCKSVWLLGQFSKITLFDRKSEKYFTHICMVFHSNLETDYDPDYLDP